MIKVWIKVYDDNYHCELKVCIYLYDYDLTMNIEKSYYFVIIYNKYIILAYHIAPNDVLLCVVVHKNVPRLYATLYELDLGCFGIAIVQTKSKSFQCQSILWIYKIN